MHYYLFLPTYSFFNIKKLHPYLTIKYILIHLILFLTETFSFRTKNICLTCVNVTI